MEDKLKYYTPAIEEFHVGFEFQMHNKGFEYGSWLARLMDVNDSISSVKFWIDNNDIRVKYLDKEDIESLGWTETNTPGFFDLKNNDRFFLSTFNNPIQRIEIGDQENEFEFAGYIKNKSELARLMVQLGIKNG